MPGLPVALQYDQTFTEESLTFRVLETFHRERAAIVHTGYQNLSPDLEMHQVFSFGTKVSVPVQNFHRDECQIPPVRTKRVAVGCQPDSCRYTRRMDFAHQDFLSVLSRHGLHRAIPYTPSHMEIIPSLTFCPLALAVHKKLHLVGLVVIHP